MVTVESIAEASSWEFDVRLKRRAGPRARLLVDARGIELSPTRTTLPRLNALEGRFVSRSQIHNVYRESDCIQVECRDGAHYSSLQFWAEDAASAARIVGHLPTTRTVEVEALTRLPPRPRTYPLGMIIALSVVVALTLISAGIWWAQHALRPTAVRAPPHTVQPHEAVVKEATKPTPRTSASQIQALQEELQRSMEVSQALRSEFQLALSALEAGGLSADDFSLGLERFLVPQWEQRERALDTGMSTDPRLRELRQLSLNAARDWEAALHVYVTGLRDRDPKTVLHAFRLIGMAEQADRAAQDLVDRAAKATAPSGMTN
jgi:uncharacterized membrane protein